MEKAITRLMSFCTQPTVAAKKAVVAPMKVTSVSACGAISISGDMRAIRKTPAVTMVAAWISAETGVGPSMASGSQVCSTSCADLPQAPAKSSTPITSMEEKPKMVWPCASGSAAKISLKPSSPKVQKVSAMPIMKNRSPTRLTMKAFIAARFALSRS